MNGKDGIYTIPEACKLLGMSRQALLLRVNQEPPPLYAAKNGRSWSIDINHPEFKALISEYNFDDKIEDSKSKESNDYEKSLEDLRYKSRAATLELPIQKKELNAYQIEQEKVKLQKEAKNLIEYDLANFLFIGYLERINRESLNFPKRIEKEIDLIIQGGIHAKHDSHIICKKVIKIISRELEAILRDVIKEQKKDVLDWKENN